MNNGDLALACWRLEEWVDEVNVERKTKALSSLRQIKRYLSENGIEFFDYLGQKYDSGWSIDVLGIEADPNIPEEELIVVETLVPLIVENGEVIKFGQVILGEEIKERATNNELPPDPEKAIAILTSNIDTYCHAPYRNKQIVSKFRKIKEKLKKQLNRINKERKK